MGCPVPAYAANYSASSFYNFFLLAAPPFITHAIRNRATSCFCPQGYSCRFPLSRSLRPNFPAYPSTQEASVASRLFSYAASIPIRFRGSGDFSRHWQESCRPCDLRCVLPNPMSLCVLLFHKCFWPKSQSFSVAKIVCSRERLMSLDQCPAAQIFLYQACGFGELKIKSICWQSLVHPFSAPTFSAP